MRYCKYFLKKQELGNCFGYLVALLIYTTLTTSLSLNTANDIKGIMQLITVSILQPSNTLNVILPLSSILFLINWKMPTIREVYSLNDSNKIVKFIMCSITFNVLLLLSGILLGGLLFFFYSKQNLFFDSRNLTVTLLLGSTFIMGFFSYYFVLAFTAFFLNKIYAFFLLTLLSFGDNYISIHYNVSLYFFHGIGQLTSIKIGPISWAFDIILYSFFLYITQQFFVDTIERRKIYA
ncbi:MAG: hypothetical protein ABF483_02325 [Liquorilactobacillus nagelii]|jgi:hypothetical protein|uniref:Uncharacterized protein n=1 Tax=Liquorilactobacillus nagelii TaxID=82688 RepID=A0A3S6QXZ1_9LACO|nr:hypothetical protein [Liquorilactobacillus nagelii]AUJ32913.1 hypothetical protein BSQ50_10405 [Liquorilactobacillus nagelii]MCC7616340.1 hypothetical protein [Liquorilactobacillus nagelii]MCP9315100.1 hypothetical protein [Liquorilactobacillus nagelii]